MPPKRYLPDEWIPIQDRLPPDSSKIEVAVYIPAYRRYAIRQSQIARLDAKRSLEMGDDYTENAAWDRIISHWKCMFPPKIKGEKDAQRVIRKRKRRD